MCSVCRRFTPVVLGVFDEIVKGGMNVNRDTERVF